MASTGWPHPATEMGKFQFEQGALGHLLRRPTCCLSSLGLAPKNSRAFVFPDTGEPNHSVLPHGSRITVVDAIHEWSQETRDLGVVL